MGGGDPVINGDGSSSSEEEDGDADWKAAINSVATVGFSLSASNGRSKPDPAAADSSSSSSDDDAHHDQLKRPHAPKLKLYQIKAQKLLDDLLDRSLEIVRDPIPPIDEISRSDEAGIRLFRKSPLGIIVDPVGENLLPRKKPRILPREEINEKSKKFKRQIRSVAVDGNDILAAATESCQRSLARSEARDAAAKAAAKREEQRVSELKKARGEKWLP